MWTKIPARALENAQFKGRGPTALVYGNENSDPRYDTRMGEMSVLRRGEKGIVGEREENTQQAKKMERGYEFL